VRPVTSSCLPKPGHRDRPARKRGRSLPPFTLRSSSSRNARRSGQVALSARRQVWVPKTTAGRQLWDGPARPDDGALPHTPKVNHRKLRPFAAITRKPCCYWITSLRRVRNSKTKGRSHALQTSSVARCLACSWNNRFRFCATCPHGWFGPATWFRRWFHRAGYNFLSTKHWFWKQ
jgi:hypothetical protein